MKNTDNNDSAKWAEGIFTDIIKRYCVYTRTNLKKELENIPVVDYSTYGGNITAIASFLRYSMCIIDIYEPQPELGEKMDPEGGSILVTEFMSQQLLVEVLDHKYTRLKSQQELEALVKETGGVYLVVNDFVDFYHQLGEQFMNCQK